MYCNCDAKQLVSVLKIISFNIQIFNLRFICVKFLKNLEIKVFIERRTRKKVILYVKVEIFYLCDTYMFDAVLYGYLEHKKTL